MVIGRLKSVVEQKRRGKRDSFSSPAFVLVRYFHFLWAVVGVYVVVVNLLILNMWQHGFWEMLVVLGGHWSDHCLKWFLTWHLVLCDQGVAPFYLPLHLASPSSCRTVGTQPINYSQCNYSSFKHFCPNESHHCKLKSFAGYHSFFYLIETQTSIINHRAYVHSKDVFSSIHGCQLCRTLE